MCGTSEEMILRHYRKWIPGLQVGAGRKIGTLLQGAFTVRLPVNRPPKRPHEDLSYRKLNQIRRLAWRRGGDSNPRSHKGSRDFESRRLNQTPEPLRNRSAFTFADAQSRKRKSRNPRPDKSSIRDTTCAALDPMVEEDSCSRGRRSAFPVTNADNESNRGGTKPGRRSASRACCALCDPCAIRMANCAATTPQFLPARDWGRIFARATTDRSAGFRDLVKFASFTQY